jgi:alpha-beta hydrolase superfamily lysophospholipase
MRKWLLRIGWGAVLVIVTLVLGGAIQAVLRVPDLSEWHRFAPQAELRAADIGESFTLEQYLRREDELFAEVHRHLAAKPIADAAGVVWNRYVDSSPSAPLRAGRDWNRTFEVVPDSIRAGALLVHGLTDSPYSMRAIAEELRGHGVYALSLRMPGHGTVPGALAAASGEDWMAAVRMGVRHVRRRIGPGLPLILVGYSNGGALVARYAVEAAGTSSTALPAASAIVLISPMIGVSPTARLARFISALGPLPLFEKARWLDVLPEYNPFKYNSFPANAAQQSFYVSTGLHADLMALVDRGQVARLPPVLAFQSIVDATVSTAAVVQQFFDVLPKSGHELVVFDINRLSGLEPFIRPSDASLAATLLAGGVRNYRRTLVTNVSRDTLEVKALWVEAGATERHEDLLGLAWPRDMFSLSHVALPFPVNDPIYGAEPPPSSSMPVALGRLSPRGEKAILTVPVDSLMRVSWNPFFPYMAGRIGDFAETTMRAPR